MNISITLVIKYNSIFWFWNGSHFMQTSKNQIYVLMQNFSNSIANANTLHIPLCCTKRNNREYAWNLHQERTVIVCSATIHSKNHTWAGIILGKGLANERRHYIVMPLLIGWAHTQNNPCWNRKVHLKSNSGIPAVLCSSGSSGASWRTCSAKIAERCHKKYWWN